MPPRSKPERKPEEVLAEATTRDLIDYGMEPEFVGRLPVRVACSALGVDDLFAILKQSEGSLIHQYEESFRAYGIEVMFTDDGLRAMAKLAAEEQTGARGLVTVGERVLRPFKFELPGSGVRRFVVHEALVPESRGGTAPHPVGWQVRGAAGDGRDRQAIRRAFRGKASPAAGA